MNKFDRKSPEYINSFLSGSNAVYLESLLENYLENPNSVDSSWKAFFSKENNPSKAKATWARKDWPLRKSEPFEIEANSFWENPLPEKLENKIIEHSKKTAKPIEEKELKNKVLDSIRALMIIRAFRIRGHLAANLDPLGIDFNDYHPELDPAKYGFSPDDMDRKIFIDNVLGLETASMNEIIDLLKRTYCGTFALQYMHISNPDQSSWLKERIEGLGKEVQFTTEGRKAILKKLIEAEGFEKFLHVKYMGTKRFGLDGGESLMPAMEQIIKRGGNLGVKEIII